MIIDQETKKEISKLHCPNKANHVSAFASSGRVRCPFCRNSYETPVYVLEEIKSEQERRL